MRPLTEEDWPFILACLREIKRESPVYAVGDDGPDNADRVRQYFKAAFYHKVMFGVIEPDKGFMFGSISHRWWAPDTTDAFEQLLYVREPYRGSLLAGRLIKSWERAAKELGAVRLHAGASMNLQDDKVISLYEALGWNRSKTVEKQLYVCAGT